ncbi:MAG TPA: protein phosphatase 2C domain-containing protein [Kribbella sp.]
MTLSLDYAALSDVGRVRRNNEDSAYAGPHLLLLADGMGGAAAGEVASAAAVQVIRKLDKPGITGHEMIEALAGAVHRANERLSELVEEDPEREGMGSTVTALLFDGQQLGLAHLGDSRAYRMRDGRLYQLSHDHTFVQSLVDEGRISREEAFTHPHRNLILRVLDGRPDSDPDLEMLDVQAGDRLLLCSDGLPDYVSDQVISTSMAEGTPDSVVVDLITHALEGGSNDNVTCVVADVVEAEPSSGVQPQLVGAAAELAQGGTGRAEPTVDVLRAGGDGGKGGTAADVDLEELRYAPQPPKRFLWLRRLAVLVVVLILVGGSGWFAYGWTQRQYYVGTDGDYVAIFKGVDAGIPGVTLSNIYEQQRLQVDKLPTYSREQVEGSIQAESLSDARTIVGRLQQSADDCAAKPTPKPTPKPPPKSSLPPVTVTTKPVTKTPTGPASRPATTPPSISGSTTPTIPVDPNDCDGVR